MKNKLNLPELESKKVFAYFEELAAIPHGSRNTRQISDYLISFAKEHGFDYVQDEMNNVIINKPATPGYENAPSVILQGHMDMVCEKRPDVQHDFEKDGLNLQPGTVVDIMAVSGVKLIVKVDPQMTKVTGEVPESQN